MQKKIKVHSNARILLMVNDLVGHKITKYLYDKRENIVALFLHNPNMQKCTEEIIKSSGLTKKDIYTAKILSTDRAVQIISRYKPDIIITCYWAHLLKPEIFKLPKYGCINFHPGMLPQNGGWYPNVWPFLDGSKAGVTLHLIDEGADTGSILSQIETPILNIDNAGTLYTKQQKAMINLFKDTWDIIKTKGISPISQDKRKACYHKKKDILPFNEIDLNRKYTGEEFINILKARTFGENTFSYYFKDDEKIFVKLVLSKERSDKI